MSMIKKVLIPTDGTDYSSYALDYAMDFCKELHAEIVLVSVVDVHYEMYDVYSEIHAPAQIDEMIRKQLNKALDKQAAKIRERGIPVRKILKVGDVIQEILDTVETEDVDLIVVGTHGRKGFSRFLLGSTTEKLVRSAPCPVLTVRPTE
jgi:nucleotide-binding universal stress UspA family protein